MAKKSRYQMYLQGAVNLRNNKKTSCSTPKSILAKLKTMKDKEFMMRVPVGDTDGK